MPWCRDDSALPLLDGHGGPFTSTSFRSAVAATAPEWRDASFGAALPDGTTAAVPVLVRHGDADSLPPSVYGGVVSTRLLTVEEERALLAFAYDELGVDRFEARSLDLEGAGGAGDEFASATVVFTGDGEPAASYSRLTRRSLAKATRAGCVVDAGATHDAFWPVYAAASSNWSHRYPERLVRALVDEGTARVHAVRLHDEVVATLLTVVRGTHWMCWLAGQDKVGRGVAASYLAYDALLAEAHAAAVHAVNLGASVAGGVEFKQHLGGVQRPMRRWKSEPPARTFSTMLRGWVPGR